MKDGIIAMSSIDVTIREAAVAGDPEAQYMVGQVFLERSSSPADQERAYRWLLHASEQGLVEARLRLGQLCDTPGPMENPAEAFRWYRLVADAGNSFAEYKLGCMYGSGRGVDVDAEEAERWFLLAAHHGLPSDEPFQSVYQSGEAESLYQRGAERGDASAQFHLADLLESDGRKDDALRWFRAAAAQGHPEGEFRLGCLLAESKQRRRE